MEELIKQAFLHIDVLGPRVHEGHYDLVGPNGEIILPQVWETTVQPGWAITMYMWPMPESSSAPTVTPDAHSPPLGVQSLPADPMPGGVVNMTPNASSSKSRPKKGPSPFLQWAATRPNSRTESKNRRKPPT
jgi:hypothetical protein